MNPPDPDLEKNISAAIGDAGNVGEMENADAVGTAGSEDCGDMLRMWIKFREENGRKVIDRASFQTFGCQTALAVATLATKMIEGKTSAEALAMSGQDLAAPLGALPPMKIHCAELVESALRDALEGRPATTAAPTGTAPTLLEKMQSPAQPKIILKPKS